MRKSLSGLLLPTAECRAALTGDMLTPPALPPASSTDEG